MYVRLAIKEEADAVREFGSEWAEYASSTPRFLPKLGRQPEARRV
jgi:protein-S-isoprenylcysteine O-methyltransferase Ste14